MPFASFYEKWEFSDDATNSDVILNGAVEGSVRSAAAPLQVNRAGKSARSTRSPFLA